MASQTPNASEYQSGWGAISELMLSGSSWSGHEANCVYLNLGGGRFVDASAISGLAYEDDARAAVSVDWNRDGAPDLWLRNRSAPQLRYLEARSPEGTRFVTLTLEGRSCNRDAIGAVVEMRGYGRSLLRHIAAGDGYLAQSSTRLTFAFGPRTAGLDDEPAGEEELAATVHWPGGAVQELAALLPNTSYRVVEGEEPEALPAGPEEVDGELARGALPVATDLAARIVLRRPFPLAARTRARYAPSNASAPAVTRLFVLWSHTCAACAKELSAFATERERFAANGITITPVCVDSEEDAGAAQAFYTRALSGVEGGEAQLPSSYDPGLAIALSASLEHVLEPGYGGELPAALLVDRGGFVQSVYRGMLAPERALADARALHEAQQPPPRASWPGLWLFGLPRDFRGLAQTLRARGYPGEAAFYRTLQRARERAQNR